MLLMEKTGIYDPNTALYHYTKVRGQKKKANKITNIPTGPSAVTAAYLPQLAVEKRRRMTIPLAPFMMA